jgi:hypothetical protein
MNHTSFSKGTLKKEWESVKVDIGIRAFISKPVLQGDFASAIRKVLG